MSLSLSLSLSLFLSLFLFLFLFPSLALTLALTIGALGESAEGVVQAVDEFQERVPSRARVRVGVRVRVRGGSGQALRMVRNVFTKEGGHNGLMERGGTMLGKAEQVFVHGHSLMVMVMVMMRAAKRFT